MRFQSVIRENDESRHNRWNKTFTPVLQRKKTQQNNKPMTNKQNKSNTTKKQNIENKIFKLFLFF